jgi:hypothetical protein
MSRKLSSDPKTAKAMKNVVTSVTEIRSMELDAEKGVFKSTIKRVVINGVDTFYRTTERRRFSRSSNIL